MPVFLYHAGMLSYQHAYHAGNFADCHKHATLCALIEAMQQKDSAITFYDFFAGRGQYDFSSLEALKTGEYRDGILRIWDKTDAPEALQNFLSLIKQGNPDKLQYYPGSPKIMQYAMREQDRMICVDGHPQEFDALQYNLGDDTHITLHKRDAWEAVSALLPPKGADKTPRGLVVIDPAYEVKSDYTVLVKKMAAALEKFAHGVYLIWYPMLPTGHHDTMLQEFKKQIGIKTLNSQLIVQKPQERGMYGSGLLIINPPWQFENSLNEMHDWLAKQLAVDTTAQHSVNWLVQEK